MVLIAGAATLALATPAVAWGWSPALWLGMPRALWWVIGWLLAVFLALAFAYVTEPVAEQDGERAEPTPVTGARESERGRAP